MKKTILFRFSYQCFKGFFLLFSFFLSPHLFGQSADSAIFKDDFNRSELGDSWVADASWSVRDSSAYNFIDGTGGTLKTAEQYTQPSYIIETTASGFTGSYMREFKITFGQSNLANDSMYVVRLSMSYGGRLTLGRAADNVYFPETLDEAGIYPHYNDIQKYKFKIARYKSGLIQVYVDKGSGYGASPLLEAIDTTYKEMGHVGWMIDTQTSAESFYVEDMQAYLPPTEKPAIKEKPAEDDLITEVNAASGNAYTVSKMDTGKNVYTDRNFILTSIPAYLKGASYIQTANDDKKSTADDFLSMFIKKAAIVYVFYDPRGSIMPAWLSDWTKTGDSITTNNVKMPYYEVYSRLVEYGNVYPYPLLLGGNMATHAYGAESNYLAAAVARPDAVTLQAEDALLSGAVAASNHANYKGTGFADFKNKKGDYAEWTIDIKVPGAYNLGFNYANGSANARSLNIESDGKIIAVGDFSSTSSWSSWAFLGGINVYLSPGTHKIRAAANGAAGPNIDYLSIFYIAVQAQNIAAAKGKAPYALSKPLSNVSAKAYPNPFTANTTIAYSLTKMSKVVLSVYSLQGQRVQAIVDAVQGAGNYRQIFNAAGLLRGVYFYKLKINGDIKTGKLIKQ